MNKHNMPLCGLLLIALFFPTAAFANVIWPGLMLAQRMPSWAIPAGLVLETVFFVFVLKRPALNSFLVIAAVNTFSTILGAVGTALGGLAWEFSIGIALYKFFNIGTFNPATWLFTLALAATLSYFLELKALRWFFKIELDKRGRWFFFVANVLSTLVALWAIR